ncbi:hypothetical protein L227DRAFT_70468 [Lentinus tigrinus ALCF2SS1-6]|uniref:Uncharacterized protein n=1 Tax=Lentinus tigrinus ALCF2SS1-6 TaxID=1328759 RepID=A0A5C2SCT1_9APHY|nr:hypothetical protein L227DRAFT_70468 [Lentinus tigrinus ALCF2SS1-6]
MCSIQLEGTDRASNPRARTDMVALLHLGVLPHVVLADHLRPPTSVHDDKAGHCQSKYESDTFQVPSPSLKSHIPHYPDLRSTTSTNTLPTHAFPSYTPILYSPTSARTGMPHKSKARRPSSVSFTIRAPSEFIQMNFRPHRPDMRCMSNSRAARSPVPPSGTRGTLNLKRSLVRARMRCGGRSGRIGET